MRYFYVRVDSGKSNSLFNIYYNSVSTANIANAIQYLPTFRTTPAINLTYTQLTTGNGVLVEVPDATSTIIVRDTTLKCADLKYMRK
jgi:hypothetical protein